MPAEVAEHAHRAIPGHAGAHDRAFVDVVAPVVEAEAQRVVATPAAAEPLEAGLRARAAVVGRARDQPLGVAAEIAGEAQAAPIAAAVRKVVELVDVLAAAVEDHADAAVGHLPNAGADALSPAFVAGRFGIVELRHMPPQ